MVTAGLVISASGKGGGYKLSRKPKDYTILEILEATEGPLSPVACIADKKNKCNRKKKVCITNSGKNALLFCLFHYATSFLLAIFFPSELR